MFMPNSKGEKEMSVRERKIVLALVFVGFLIFGTQGFGHPLGDNNKTRLYNSIKRRSGVPLTIDVSYTTKTITKPEAAKREEEARLERTKILRKKSNSDSITIGSFDIALSDGSKIRLSETRIRIGTGLKLRKDTTIFANTEKTETHYQATTINTGYATDRPSYEIDHKLKRAWIRIGRRWSGRKVLRFGKVDEFIVMDVVRSCKPNRSQRAKALQKRDFLLAGTDTVDGKVVDEIECIDLESGKSKYTISLDPNDWQICRRIVRFESKSGLVSSIVEYKEFAKAKGTGELFPRLIVHQYFDKEGKEEKVETINITDVVIGLPISEDIFSLDVPTDYTIIDNREN
jgi:hypothetical protein